jgi:hypothetical protein
MADRQRILFFVAVGTVSIGMLYILVFRLMIQPAAENRQAAQAVTEDIEKLELALERGETTFTPALRKWAALSFGADDLAAGEATRAHLLKLLSRAQLNNSHVRLTPQTGKKLAAGREVGWLIKTRGPLDRITDFLYLLQTDPKLHKVESVTWAPVARSTEVDLTVKYMTLVLEPLSGSPPVLVAEEQKPESDRLSDPARKSYTLIAQRDLFRPYIPRPPAPPAPRSDPPVRIDPLAVSKLVGLPTWAGKPMVVVRNTEGNTTRTYEVGQELLGGQIVMVDYRPMPDPRKPFLNSGSRVIVKIGRDHWAVELGQMLSERRRLSDTQVPPQLKEPADSPPPSAAEPPPVEPTRDEGRTEDQDNAVTQETSHAP